MYAIPSCVQSCFYTIELLLLLLFMGSRKRDSSSEYVLSYGSIVKTSEPQYSKVKRLGIKSTEKPHFPSHLSTSTQKFSLLPNYFHALQYGSVCMRILEKKYNQKSTSVTTTTQQPPSMIYVLYIVCKATEEELESSLVFLLLLPYYYSRHDMLQPSRYIIIIADRQTGCGTHIYPT